MRKVFLKLDGIKGGARHAGEIEVSSFFWVAKQSSNQAGARDGSDPLNDLTVIKQPDHTSPLLSFAAQVGQRFDGVLTVEDVSVTGGAVRRTVYALRSAVVESVAAFRVNEETVTLNCRSINIVRS
jgi:type VI protein secretion system component Hcp